ncbi:DUF4864 domain-containing protein [Labrys monachus]|uniref:DUF4864 domain-containing protein n=1 Tax=Labrys monachus TaxID=217067 RepID=A0ABU0FG78_9HYPH|nr:DUF4864 domain-containing protein [Labrys monachus]MDQ0393134.1 hypothetical protein [Labrys monachus]
MRIPASPCILACLAFTSPLCAHAQSDEDQTQVRTIISRQIAAFEHDDSTAAYSFAAPVLRQAFPTPEDFMASVRSGYSPIYRPKSYSFDGFRTAEGKFIQGVEILGQDGTYWEALYTLVRQDDGTWKIAGCLLVKTAAISA